MKSNNLVYYCVDDPKLPFKVVVKYLGSLVHPMASSLMSNVRNGDSVILEIKPSYYSTGDYSEKRR